MTQIQSRSTLASHGETDAIISKLAGAHRRKAISGEQLALGGSAFVAAVGDAMMLSLAVAPTLAIGALMLKAVGVNVL